PTETEVPSQEQSEVIEFMRKGFEDMRMMMFEGFTRLSERIDGLDIHMTSQDVDIRSLRDEFRGFKGGDVAFDPPEHQDGAPAQDWSVTNPLNVDSYLMGEIVGFDIKVDQTRRQGTTISSQEKNCSDTKNCNTPIWLTAPRMHSADTVVLWTLDTDA
ncbi:hypothetical protein PIB30_078760, partial [Stylosanthes scabra]|nr:hypothetical protein [Stylosanthes scabra]